MSFSIVWGVAETTLLSSQTFFLSSGFTVPVRQEIFSSGIFNTFLKVLECCSARGFVGARKRIFESGFFCNTSAATSAAIIVFPSAVGATIKEFPLSITLAASISWYSLLSTRFSLIKECFMKAIIPYLHYTIT